MTATEHAPLVLARRGHIAELELNRPDKLNAINEATLRALAAAIEEIDAEEEIRVAILSGRGRGFSAGGDLEEVSELTADPAAFSDFLDRWHAALRAVRCCRVPVIAAVHGFAYAGGLELVQVCDLVVVGANVTIADRHATVGLFPAGGAVQRLARQLPDRVAAWALMSGEPIAPEDALRWGLVNAIAPDGEERAEALRMAALLAGKSPSAVQSIKQALRRGDGLPSVDALAVERPLAVAHMTSAEARVGFDAFRRRLTPTY
jgi:enoyl-CoA hydratase/carnithine racemase